MTGELWYRGVPVGRLADVYTADGTWFGTVSVATTEPDIRAYIAFCVDWNERQHDPEPPDAVGFDRFVGLVDGHWSVRLDDGGGHAVEDAPVFFVGDEVTWTASASR